MKASMQVLPAAKDKEDWYKDEYFYDFQKRNGKTALKILFCNIENSPKFSKQRNKKRGRSSIRAYFGEQSC